MLPVDLSTLFLFVGMMLSIVAGEAAINGDTLNLKINLPQKLEQSGFDADTAEKLFIAESAWIVRGTSIIPTPTLRVSSRPSVISALATPLKLDRIVGALQDQFGYDRLVVSAAMLSAAENALRMVIIVEHPLAGPDQIQLTQADGDPAALVRRGAAATMERVSPYRVAQAYYIRGLENADPGALKDAAATASRHLARPWEPSRASERAMLYNLMALLALLDNKIALADQMLRLVDPIPGVLAEARAIVALNRAFLTVAANKPAEARALFDAGEKLAAAITLPDFDARVVMLGALVAWSEGDKVEAERRLRAAIVAMPSNERPHAYLATLLGTTVEGAGDKEKAEQASAVAANPFTPDLPFFAQSVFSVDPVNGGIRRY
jgi:hypothetical protein